MKKENKILYRIERPRSHWELENSMNYIEIRSLDDVDKKILIKFCIKSVSL